MAIKTLAQGLTFINLYSEDLTGLVFLLANLAPSSFIAYFIHSIVLCYFLKYQCL